MRTDDCESTGAGISRTEAETDIRVLVEKVESDKQTLLEEELYIKRIVVFANRISLMI